MSSRAVLHGFPTSSDRGITCIPGFSLDTKRRNVPANFSFSVWSYTSATSSSFSQLDIENERSSPQQGVQLLLWTLVFWILPQYIASCSKARGTKISNGVINKAINIKQVLGLHPQWDPERNLYYPLESLCPTQFPYKF